MRPDLKTESTRSGGRGSGAVRLARAWASAWFVALPAVAVAQTVPLGPPVVVEAPGFAEVVPEGMGLAGDPSTVGTPVLPPDVMVVRFDGPPGTLVEVLGPTPEPLPTLAEPAGIGTFGLRVGVGYRLRVTNIPNREGLELFPIVEVVGHLHRPPAADPLKYPAVVPIDNLDIEDVLLRNQLVTQVIYLERPEDALPLSIPDGGIPVATITASEDPLKLAEALGRPMLIVRIGSRAPLPEELAGEPIFPIAPVPCPLATAEMTPCPVACGPIDTPPTAPGAPRAPLDEYLCDGGDTDNPATLGGDGALRGIDPRDAVVGFRDDRRARVLPTNRVCVYSPRFAAIRVALGATQSTAVEVLAGHETLSREQIDTATQQMRRLDKNEAPGGLRHRSRPSALVREQGSRVYDELRILAGLDTFDHLAGHVTTQGSELTSKLQAPVIQQRNIPTLGIKTAEGLVVNGVVQGPNAQVMSWKPQESVGVEVPPNKPGLAVVKQIDVPEAAPGDVLTVTIRYRNIGNVPIGSISIVDSLLPRLEYVPGSAQGPSRTVFTAEPNLAGSAELRWDLPEPLPPGAEGAVLFKALVR